MLRFACVYEKASYTRLCLINISETNLKMILRGWETYFGKDVRSTEKKDNY